MSRITSLAAWAQARLQEDFAKGIDRHLSTIPENVIPFCSNDYYGLSHDSRLISAAEKALVEYGVGAGAARLISGNQPPHTALEKTLAEWKNTEAALLFPSGYMSALGTISALCDENDTILLDKRCHACLMDGARLSGARRLIFAHNDMNYLADLLETELLTNPARRIIVIVESLYSMDGDFAPLQEIVALKQKYDFILIVDEAHATGLYGPHRAGKIEELNLVPQIDVQLFTLGKSIGTAGGAVAASADVIQLLTNRAKTFLFTTAQPAFLAAASLAGVNLIRGPEGLAHQKRIHENIEILRAALANTSFALQTPGSPILPIMIGDETKATTAAEHLLKEGFFVPAVRHPTVPMGKARLRVTMNSTASPEQVQQLARAILKATQSMS